MVHHRSAIRYAKSIFDLAKDMEKLDLIQKDMELVLEACQDRSLYLCLSSPIIKNYDKEAILLKIFANKVNQITAQFLSLVSKKGRANILREISQAFIDIYNQANSITTAELTTAIEANQSIIDDVTHMLNTKFGKKIVLSAKVDKRIIGGYIIDVENQQLNHSVKHKLETIRTHLK